MAEHGIRTEGRRERGRSRRAGVRAEAWGGRSFSCISGFELYKLMHVRPEGNDTVAACPECGSANCVHVAHGVDGGGEWSSEECEDCGCVWTRSFG